jgi:hypothetical protein
MGADEYLGTTLLASPISTQKPFDPDPKRERRVDIGITPLCELPS